MRRARSMTRWCWAAIISSSRASIGSDAVGPHAHAVPAARLRRVEGLVGAREELARIDLGRRAGVRDSRGNRDPEVLTVDLEALPFERLPDALGDRPRRRRRRVGEERREFLSSQAAREVARADHAAHDLAETADDEVSGGVTERVVDRLEAVEVEARDRKGGFVSIPARPLRREARLEIQ